MPSLEWIGKEKVVNHHLEVPYHVLQRQYSYDENGQHEEDNGSENMIIHGDNLLALKSLLPKYEGRISCIYIDPPYNTGNEGWVYNDNVNDPRIKKWLGEVVGKEGDDLSRHDKWLCMMYPRLKLLQRLLADDGAIFISIDDNEQANLKLICDEIFGGNNFISDIACVNKPSGRSDDKYIATAYEHILIYKNIGECQFYGFEAGNHITKRYSKIDKSGRKYREEDLRKRGTHDTRNDRPNLFYPFYYQISTDTLCVGDSANIECNEDLVCIVPMKSQDVEGTWRWGKDTAKKQLKYLHARYMPNKNQWSIFEWQYLDERDSVKPTSVWSSKDVNSERGSELLVNLGFKKQDFQNPKPLGTLARILKIATNKNAIVLDSFAGSGTTAHAVLKANQEDGGHRQFILVEMEDYADSITAERVKRVIHGYSTNKKDVLYDTPITTKNIKHGGDLFAEAKEIADDAKASYDKVEGPKMVDGHLQVIGIEKAKENQKGTGGSFSFYELGAPLFHGDLLNEDVGIDTIREYVYFMETRQNLPEAKADEPYYLGSYVGPASYFYYEKDEATTLNREFLHTVRTRADHYVIYADRCTLSEAELDKFQITFKKIPRDIARL